MKFPQLNESPVVFVADGHHYYLAGRELYGITSTLIPCAYPDTYKTPDGFTEEEWRATLDAAAEKGTQMHQLIELYDDMGAESDSPELRSYIAIKDANKLTALRSEYIVSDGEHFATAIDKVMLNADGEIILVDLKRTATLHMEEVTLQLSIGKWLFEMQNPHLRVAAIYVCWLRGEESRFRRLDPWSDEQLNALVDAFNRGGRYTVEVRATDLQRDFAEAEKEIARLEMAAKAAAERQKELKEGLYELMVANHVKSLDGQFIRLTVVPPSEKVSFDAKRMKEEMPDIYEKYACKTTRNGFLKLTLK